MPNSSTYAHELLLATVLVENAATSRSARHLRDSASLRAYRWYNSAAVKTTVRIAVATILFLAFAEEPQSIVVEPLAVATIEVLCLLVFAGQLIAKYRFLGPGRLFQDRKNTWHLVVLALNVIDLGQWTMFRYFGSIENPVRYTRVARVWYLIYSHKSVRFAVRDIEKTARDIVDVLALVLLVMIFYTCVCVILFADSPAGGGYFDGPAIAFINLFALSTTVNYPDIQLAATEESLWWSLLFVSYLVFVLYLGMNLVLAVVYNNYRIHFKDDLRHKAVERLQLLDEAFSLLVSHCDGTRVSRAVFDDLLQSLSSGKSSSFGGSDLKSAQKRDILFTMLDEDDEGGLRRSQFRRLVELFDVRLVEKLPLNNIFDKFFPSIYRSSGSLLIRRFFISSLFQKFIDTLIVVNGLLIVVSFYVLGTDGEGGSTLSRGTLLIMEILLTCVFWLEALGKLYALGPQSYLSTYWNRFDLAIVLCSSVDIVLFVESGFFTVEGAGRHSTLARLVLLARTLRLVRLIHQIRRFRIIINAMLSISPLMSTYAACMGALYYTFAMVGMQLWANRVSRDDPAVVASLYGQNNYYVNNFNTFAHSLVVMFELQVSNNWHVIASGFAAVSGMSAYLYFIVFSLLSQVMIMNIVVAFILEVFQLQYEIFLLHEKKGDPFQHRLDFLMQRSMLLGNWRAERRHRRGNNAIHTFFREEIEQELSDHYAIDERSIRVLPELDEMASGGGIEREVNEAVSVRAARAGSNEGGDATTVGAGEASTSGSSSTAIASGSVAASGQPRSEYLDALVAPLSRRAHPVSSGAASRAMALAKSAPSRPIARPIAAREVAGGLRGGAALLDSRHNPTVSDYDDTSGSEAGFDALSSSADLSHNDELLRNFAQHTSINDGTSP